MAISRSKPAGSCPEGRSPAGTTKHTSFGGDYSMAVATADKYGPKPPVVVTVTNCFRTLTGIKRMRCGFSSLSGVVTDGCGAGADDPGSAGGWCFVRAVLEVFDVYGRWPLCGVF